MNAKFPTLEERKRLLKSFHDLPPEDKQTLYKAVEHLRWLTILWGLEEIGSDSMPSIPEKKHILLAYKLLEILWFEKLPEGDNQIFTIYVRDRLHQDQDPQEVNDLFDTDTEELAARCKSLARPNWLTNQVKATEISLESFPNRVAG